MTFLKSSPASDSLEEEEFDDEESDEELPCFFALSESVALVSELERCFFVDFFGRSDSDDESDDELDEEDEEPESESESGRGTLRAAD
jgi:hypothetical protein